LPACGDDIVDTDEECDDGNNFNGDGCQANCKLPTAGFVLAYGFEEAGGSTVLDESGNGNNGTLSGGSRIAAGYHGSRAVEFDPVTSPGHVGLISSGNLDIAGNKLTISMWIRADDFGIPDARLISKAEGITDPEHYWMISTVQEGANFYLRGRIKTDSDGSTTTLKGLGEAINAQEWTFVTMTYDGDANSGLGEFKLYKKTWSPRPAWRPGWAITRSAARSSTAASTKYASRTRCPPRAAGARCA
jgi:cysteine-rich repeat protein